MPSCLYHQMTKNGNWLDMDRVVAAHLTSLFLSLLQMSKVWNDLKPKLSCLFAGPHSVLTPPRSPQEDGVCPH